MFSRLKSGAVRNWLRLLSVVVLVTSSSTIVLALPTNYGQSDCWRVMATCQLVVADQQSTGKEFASAFTYSQIPVTQKVTYTVAFWGELESDTNTTEFISQAFETLSDERGWLRAGYLFSRVNNGGDFTLILSQAELLDDIPGCDSNWSCRSGRNVIINENRWRGGTTAWNEAGGSLRDYRHMVLNHETGHWLGHGHYNCSQGENGFAPVMQQQSIDLQGCDFNPWPLEFEIEAI